MFGKLQYPFEFIKQNFTRFAGFNSGFADAKDPGKSFSPAAWEEGGYETVAQFGDSIPDEGVRLNTLSKRGLHLKKRIAYTLSGRNGRLKP